MQKADLSKRPEMVAFNHAVEKVDDKYMREKRNLRAESGIKAMR
ncbi:hypothetical protein [Herbaspirillum huttiense]|jgi:hypothetical protein|uniref:Uncharacterized protein n=2 Tax=Herbaspirillum huttiense TaxID=863372 RepID=A0AAJ2H6A4_9BURK|nr:hypothetical protein [Herbaspirillum huttiense]MDR9835139.1 hypothetical protein [Herbaspirillum huttiense]